jgi:hypothetical protein
MSDIMPSQTPSTEKPGRGRRAGSVNKTTAAVKHRIAEEHDPIDFLGRVLRGEVFPGVIRQKDKETGLVTDIPVEQTPDLDQRISAGKILADKLVPNAKSRAVQIELPKIKTGEDIGAAQDAVLTAMATGAITPEEAKLISDMIENRRKPIFDAEAKELMREEIRRAVAEQMAGAKAAGGAP